MTAIVAATVVAATDDHNNNVEELQARLAERTNAVKHLRSSNVEMMQFLVQMEEEDLELMEAVGENRSIIVRCGTARLAPAQRCARAPRSV